MEDSLRKILVIVIIGLTCVAIFLYQFDVANRNNGTDGLPIIFEPLEAIPPVDPVPGTDPITIDIEALTITVVPRFVLYMLHSGNVYHVILEINITNHRTTDITKFNATKVSVYNETSHLYYTFGLLTSDNLTIPAGETRIFTFTEDRRMPVVYSMWGYVLQYARVLVSLDIATTAILTSHLREVMIAIE